MNLQTYDQIFDSHLRIKVMVGLYVEAMHLQCFPPTLRECVLFRKRVLLLAEYGPGCSTLRFSPTCLHIYTDTHTKWSYSTLQDYSYRYGTYAQTLSAIIISTQMWNKTFLWQFFSCLVCGRLKKWWKLLESE